MDLIIFYFQVFFYFFILNLDKSVIYITVIVTQSDDTQNIIKDSEIDNII